MSKFITVHRPIVVFLHPTTSRSSLGAGGVSLWVNVAYTDLGAVGQDGDGVEVGVGSFQLENEVTLQSASKYAAKMIEKIRTFGEKEREEEEGFVFRVFLSFLVLNFGKCSEIHRLPLVH